MDLTRKFKLENFFIMATIISLAFENFQLIEVAGGAFKPTQVIAIIAIISIVVKRGLDQKAFIRCIAFCMLPLLPIYRINDMTEFFKTYLNYIVMVMFICFVMPNLKRVFNLDVEKYLKCFNVVISIVCILGILQFLMMNLLGVFFLDGVFGPFEFRGNAITQESGMYRAFSVFHEPSYFGWVCDIALAINLSVKTSKQSTNAFVVALTIISILVSLSSSAIWIMVIILALNLLIVKRTNKTQTMLALFAIVALVFVVFMFDLSFIGDSMLRLFTEKDIKGTSGYERITIPIEYIKKTMENYPFLGRGLGQQGDIDAVGQISTHKGIHNSVLSAIVTFGVISIFYYAWIVKIFFGKRFNRRLRKERILLFVATLGMYFSTGAFLSFDTFIFTIIIILFLDAIVKGKAINSNGEQLDAEADNIRNSTGVQYGKISEQMR